MLPARTYSTVPTLLPGAVPRLYRARDCYVLEA